MSREPVRPTAAANASLSRRRLLARAAGVGLSVPGVALLIAACGGGGPAAANTPEPTADAASATAATPAAGRRRFDGTPSAQPTITLTQTAGSYKLLLRVGPPTRVFTQAQAEQQHPASGEILLSGAMPTFNGTPVAGRARQPGATPPAGFTRTPNGTPFAGAGRAAFAGAFHQLALYVTDATSGQPVTSAQVTITVTDNTANTAPADVPIATLEAVGKGAADFHYGNDVVMPPNRSYNVKVTVNGTPATFSFLLH